SGPERNLREIANQLGVSYILEGSVQRVGNRVRVNAQLIDANLDSHVWGEHYDRDVADIFALESELAQKIVAQLQTKLSPAEAARARRRGNSTDGSPATRCRGDSSRSRSTLLSWLSRL